MTEPAPLDMFLSNAIRFLIAEGLPLEIVDEGGRQRYILEGKELTTEQIIAGASLLGMGNHRPLN
ncbi:hypothetical protein [Methylobacterium planeticum]|uniref:Uncharacterized protein n=1 Tax=Methylobacterium planeticum TaxID=2615211 RepID=A0A6N6MTA8_9HYPH|nr:hypothetical protein [Methylobacterium planeticum]KAB1072948.1 hypothetical protein F6X51_13240 [Methylobacterium planeticum]